MRMASIKFEHNHPPVKHGKVGVLIVDLGKRDLQLGAGHSVWLGNTGRRHPPLVAGPAIRQTNRGARPPDFLKETEVLEALLAGTARKPAA